MDDPESPQPPPPPPTECALGYKATGSFKRD